MVYLFMDQIVPVMASIAGNTTIVPTSVNFTDTASSLYSGLAAVIGFIGIILSTPGFKTWMNHAFGIRKEQIDASAALIGTLANQAIKSKEQITWVIQLVYNLASKEQKEVLDKQVAPILADIEKSIDQINTTLDQIIPKAHPALTARINRNSTASMEVYSSLLSSYSLNKYKNATNTAI